jgi:hypothetical protein
MRVAGRVVVAALAVAASALASSCALLDGFGDLRLAGEGGGGASSGDPAAGPSTGAGAGSPSSGATGSPASGAGGEPASSQSTASGEGGDGGSGGPGPATASSSGSGGASSGNGGGTPGSTYVYVIGGYANAGPVADVQVARIGRDGLLEGFTAATALPSGRWGHAAYSHGGYLFVSGGCGVTSCVSTAPLTEHLAAEVLPDGSLGPWVQLSPVINNGRLWPAPAVFQDDVLLFGGYDGTEDSEIILRSPLDGAIPQAWAIEATLDPGRSAAATVVHDGWIILVGGNASLTTSAIVEAFDPGDLGMSKLGIPLPSGRWQAAMVEASDRLYLIGGSTDPDVPPAADLDDVLIADALGSGDTSAWSPSPNPLPEPLVGLAAVAHDGRIYVLGGRSTGGDTVSSQSAAVTPPGDIGPWRVESPFSGPRRLHAAVVHTP